MGPVAETISKNLRALLQARGYTAYEKFAYEFGMEKSALGKILRGERLPRIDTAIRIAEALEVSLDDIYPLPRTPVKKPKA